MIICSVVLGRNRMYGACCSAQTAHKLKPNMQDNRSLLSYNCDSATLRFMPEGKWPQMKYMPFELRYIVIFFANSGSTSRLLDAKPAAPTQLDENEHDDPRVCCESRVVVITDTCPINSRARGGGWVAWLFGFVCHGPTLRVGRTPKK